MNSEKSDLSLLDPVFKQLAAEKDNLISILQSAQNIYGYLPKDVIEYIAEKVSSTTAQVMGVATFYSQFRLKPVGKYLIMLCQGTACHVNSSELIAKRIMNDLGISDGETTDDGLFTLKSVACLGCCSLSPVMMINGEAYGNLNPDKAMEIINNLRKI